MLGAEWVAEMRSRHELSYFNASRLTQRFCRIYTNIWHDMLVLAFDRKSYSISRTQNSYLPKNHHIEFFHCIILIPWWNLHIFIFNLLYLKLAQLQVRTKLRLRWGVSLQRCWRCPITQLFMARVSNSSWNGGWRQSRCHNLPNVGIMPKDVYNSRGPPLEHFLESCLSAQVCLEAMESQGPQRKELGRFGL